MSTLIKESVQRMDGYVPGEQPRERDIIKLNTNENPYPPSPRIAQILAEFTASGLARYPDPLAVRLRERIAALHGCAVEQVFAGNGSDEVLALCTRAFVEDDGSIGYFDPSYSLYPVLAEIRCVETRPVPLDDNFGWRMPDDYHCSLFCLTNPNAPTGIMYARDTVHGFCQQARGVVLIDEAYVDFAGQDCMDIALASRNVLVARTLSKSYSLAGLRLGYAVGDADLIAALLKVKDSYNLNMLTQAIGCAALEDVEHMRANVARIRATRARLSNGLRELGCEVFPSETNFVWVRPGGSVTAQDLFARLKQRRILVRHFEGERTGAFVRITVGTDEQVAALLETARTIVVG